MQNRRLYSIFFIQIINLYWASFLRSNLEKYYESFISNRLIAILIPLIYNLSSSVLNLQSSNKYLSWKAINNWEPTARGRWSRTRRISRTTRRGWRVTSSRRSSRSNNRFRGCWGSIITSTSSLLSSRNRTGRTRPWSSSWRRMSNFHRFVRKWSTIMVTDRPAICHLRSTAWAQKASRATAWRESTRNSPTFKNFRVAKLLPQRGRKRSGRRWWG